MESTKMSKLSPTKAQLKAARLLAGTLAQSLWVESHDLDAARKGLAKYISENLTKGVSEDLLSAANKELDRLAKRDRHDCNRD
jgi:hypothetical protein